VYEDVYNFRFHGRGEFFLLNLEHNAPGVWTVYTLHYILEDKSDFSYWLSTDWFM